MNCVLFISIFRGELVILFEYVINFFADVRWWFLCEHGINCPLFISHLQIDINNGHFKTYSHKKNQHITAKKKTNN